MSCPLTSLTLLSQSASAYDGKQAIKLKREEVKTGAEMRSREEYVNAAIEDRVRLRH